MMTKEGELQPGRPWAIISWERALEDDTGQKAATIRKFFQLFRRLCVANSYLSERHSRFPLLANHDQRATDTNNHTNQVADCRRTALNARERTLGVNC